MDWGSVTAEDPIGVLREADWTSPPRPLNEFFSKFTIPRSFPKWTSRLNCSLYYYRTNYFILIIFILGVACLTRPLAILATALSALSVVLLNDGFAVAFGEKITRTVSKLYPHLAAKMRPPHMPVIHGRPLANRSIYICASLVLWFSSGRLMFVLWAFVIGLLVAVLNTVFGTPNLKARLNTFREEFCAFWRNYSEL